MSYSSGSGMTQNEKRALFCMMGHRMLMANLMLVMHLIRSEKFFIFIVIVHFHLASAADSAVYSHLAALSSGSVSTRHGLWSIVVVHVHRELIWQCPSVKICRTDLLLSPMSVV